MRFIRTPAEDAGGQSNGNSARSCDIAKTASDPALCQSHKSPLNKITCAIPAPR